MIIKKHKTNDGRLLLAICDENIINRKFEDKNMQLDLTSDFYKGEKKEEGEILKLIREAYMITFVGEKSIKIAIREGLVRTDTVIYVKKVPYAQTLRAG